MATITGSAGNDTLLGTPFDDVIDTGGGIDHVDAGAGDDVVRLTGPVPLATLITSQIEGGIGHDILDLTNWQGVVDENYVDNSLGFFTVSADRTLLNWVAYATGFEEVHLGTNIEYFGLYTESSADPATLPGWTVIGSEGADNIGDSRGYDRIETGAGNDIVHTIGGSDRVLLGDGDDQFWIDKTTGYQDHVTLDGGAGIDSFFVTDDGLNAHISLDLGTGAGTIGATRFDLAGMENVTVEDFWYPTRVQDVMLAGSDSANAFRVSGDPATILLGRGGDDTLDGTQLSGMLTVYGGSGADEIYGGEGADWINGGGHYAGDTLVADTANDGRDFIDAGNGNDHVWGNSEFAVQGATDGGDDIRAGAGMDYVNGNAGNDSIYGGDGRDRLYGGADDDSIDGDAGNDHLQGNKGDDHLYGGDGDDELLGGQGDDFVMGGPGIDTLTGNAGNDVFGLAVSGGFTTTGSQANLVDVITDFEDGHDKLNPGNYLTWIAHPGAAADFTGALAMARTALANATDHDVAAVQVGDDTYLFYDTFHHDPQSAVRLLHVSAGTIDSFDFTL